MGRPSDRESLCQEQERGAWAGSAPTAGSGEAATPTCKLGGVSPSSRRCPCASSTGASARKQHCGWSTRGIGLQASGQPHGDPWVHSPAAASATQRHCFCSCASLHGATMGKSTHAGNHPTPPQYRERSPPPSLRDACQISL